MNSRERVRTAEKLLEAAITHAKTNTPSWYFSEQDEQYLLENHALLQCVSDVLSQGEALPEERLKTYLDTLKSHAERSSTKEEKDICSLLDQQWSDAPAKVGLYTKIILGLLGPLSSLNAFIAPLDSATCRSMLLSLTQNQEFGMLSHALYNELVRKTIDDGIQEFFMNDFKAFQLNGLLYPEILYQVYAKKDALSEKHIPSDFKERLDRETRRGMGFALKEILFNLINAPAQRDHALILVKIERLFDKLAASGAFLAMIEKDISVIEKIFTQEAIDQFLEDTKNLDGSVSDIDEHIQNFISTALEEYQRSPQMTSAF